MIGFIYIMSNPVHPDVLKIGQTSKDPDIRRNDLNSTGVLEDFILEYRVLASDYLRLEKEIHQKLNNFSPDIVGFSIQVGQPPVFLPKSAPNIHAVLGVIFSVS